jgi:hypothetical protein
MGDSVSMSLIQQTAIQLIVGVIAFLAGFFLRRVRSTLAYLRARRFWRPLLRRDLALILGDGFPQLRAFKASDLIGRGDLVASYELTTFLSQIGFRRLQPIFADGTVGEDLTGRSLRRNMIVIGGPDMNQVTLRFLSSLQLCHRFEVPEATETAELGAHRVWQIPSLVVFGPAGEKDELSFRPSVEGDELVQDYGVIVRTRNPFMPSGTGLAGKRRGKRIVIIYGCYGFGTLAAVIYSQTPEFLEMIENENDDIECIVTCRVVMGTPQSISCPYFKAHPSGALLRPAGSGPLPAAGDAGVQAT